MLNRKLFFTTLLILCFNLGQAQVAIGKWREHLSYKKGVALCQAGTRIYCATFPSLFYYETADNSINKLSKVDGISDLEVNTLKYSEKHKTLVIGYNNGNIDLIVNNTIINVPDVKRSFIQGDKSINEILIDEDLAYLSTGFGIIALDLKKKEIKETFYLGTGGTYLQVNESCIKNDTLFAATKKGIYFGDLNTNLIDFQNWSIVSNLPQGNYNTIVSISDKLICNFQLEGEWEKDTIYFFNDGIWQKKDLGNNYTNNNVQDLNVCGDEIVACLSGDTRTMDENLVESSRIYQYQGNSSSPAPQEAIKYGTEYWIADEKIALVHLKDQTSTEVISPAGPNFSDCWRMDYSDGYLWLTTGTLTPNMKSGGLKRGIAQFENEQWQSYYGGTVFDSLRDIHTIAVHPDNPDHVFAGSFYGGLLEFKNGERIKIFNETNSKIQSIDLFPWRGIGGLFFDENKNLWMTNSGLFGQSIVNPLLVLDKDRNWYSYPLNGWLTSTSFAGKIIIDKHNNKWISAYLKGLIVFNENGTLSNQSDDDLVLLTSGEASGNLPNNEINAIAEDSDGKMWIGTSTGLVVINDPQNVFTQNGVTAEKIIIEADGNANYLLGEEFITCIKIDAGDRKWIGTQGTGLYLMSADMQSEIHHFTTLNSPLLSDVIIDVEINDATGEVYISTDKGLISFMGEATEKGGYEGPTYAYPNPVPPNFTGIIGIRGVVNNSEIKITDITGNLIYETIANGTTATWNGLSLNGKKAQSGVYLVFVSNADGTETEITKILFLN